MSTDSQPAKRPQTVEEFHAEYLTDALAARAANLRRCADRLDAMTADVGRVGGPGRDTYAQVAADAHHELVMCLANLHMERLIHEAAGADIARAKGQ